MAPEDVDLGSLYSKSVGGLVVVLGWSLWVVHEVAGQPEAQSHHAQTSLLVLGTMQSRTHVPSVRVRGLTKVAKLVSSLTLPIEATTRSVSHKLAFTLSV